MTTYIWKINQMYTVQQPDPDYVVNVYYKLTGEDNGTTSSAIGNVVFSPSGQSGTFIPYDELTEQIVIGWVQQSLGPDGIQQLQDNIQGRIDQIKNPPVTPENTALPWG